MASDAPKDAAPPKPASVKKPKEEDDEPAPAPALKQKTLPTGLSRGIVIGTLLFSLAYIIVGLFGDRFAISPVPNSANAFVYRVDRLTGSVHLCGSQSCSVVQIRAAE